MYPRRWQLGILIILGSCGGDAAGALSAAPSSAPAAMTGSAPRTPAAGAAGSGAFGAGNPQATAAGVTPTMATSGAALAPPPLPPEIEVKLDFEQPQASQRFVYALNPGGGTVSIIDAETLAIQTLETGDHPTFLRTLAGSDDAIVLNVGSSDATIVRAPSKGATTTKLRVLAGVNAIAVAPDAQHAVVYYDTDLNAGASSATLQDVSVLSLKSGAERSVGMTVGFRPRDVYFAADGKKGYVVTDDGVSVLDFAQIERDGTGIARLITLGAGIDHKTMDISVTPDGHYAMARQPGNSSIRLADLSTGEVRVLDLRDTLGMSVAGDSALADGDAGVAPPTTLDVSDLDLAPNGKFALAVVRDLHAVVQIPVPTGFDASANIKTRTIPGEVIGSVSITPDSTGALLYTTAASIERITYLPLDGGAPRVAILRKTVQAVTIAPDGQTALIIHGKVPGDPDERGIDPDIKIDRSFGYSSLRLQTGDVKLQLTRRMPGSLTMVPDGSAIFLLLRDDAIDLREVQKIEAKSFLIQAITLGSPPSSLGVVPGSQRVFVSQEHPEGRITFIDWSSNEARTVTGFELNSRIRD